MAIRPGAVNRCEIYYCLKLKIQFLSPRQATGTVSAVGSARGCPSLGRRFESVYQPYHVTRSFVVHIGFSGSIPGYTVTPHR